MKISIVCFNLGWQSGGPRLIFSSAQALKRKGHEVVIYAPEFNGEYFKELWRGLDIRVVSSAEKPVAQKKPNGVISWIKRKLEQEKAREEMAKKIAEAIDKDTDILNLHDLAYSVAAHRKKINPRAKIIWTENDPPFMYLPKNNFFADILSHAYNFWKDVQSRKHFRAIDMALVLDLYNKSWCEKRGMKTAIVRLGVDPAFYLPVKNSKDKFAKKEVRLFGLGSLNQYRRYEDTIFAVKHLRDWGYNASALVIASDMWDEKIYREKIQGLIRDNGLENKIDLRLKGVSEEELLESYEKTDVFVYAMYVPPPRDGFGFSIGVFEAMAAGLPVVLCSTTTSTEVLEDKKSALFVNPMSPKEIAEKIKMLVDDPVFCESVARAGQELVKNELTWDKYAERFLETIT